MGMPRSNETGYAWSTDWDAFIEKLASYGPHKMDSLVNDSRVDQKLAMIVGVSADWRTETSRRRALASVRQAQARIVEERRLTPDPQAFRPYIDADTRALLPPIKLHRRYYRSPERQREANNALAFWTGMRRGSWRGHDIASIIARESVPLQQRRLTHPYGPPVPQEELDTLHNTFRALRPAPKQRFSFAPAGMTPERALAIAIQALGHSR